MLFQDEFKVESVLYNQSNNVHPKKGGHREPAWAPWGWPLWGLGVQPPTKFLVTTPFSRPENEGRAPFKTTYSKKMLLDSVDSV